MAGTDGATTGVAGEPVWVSDTMGDDGGTIRRGAAEEWAEPCKRLVSPRIAGDGVASGCGMERSEQSVVCGWRM